MKIQSSNLYSESAALCRRLHLLFVSDSSNLRLLRIWEKSLYRSERRLYAKWNYSAGLAAVPPTADLKLGGNL